MDFNEVADRSQSCDVTFFFPVSIIVSWLSVSLIDWVSVVLENCVQSQIVKVLKKRILLAQTLAPTHA